MSSRHLLRVVLCIVAMAAALAHATVASAQSRYALELPSQPLADTLRAIGRQTNTNVIFDAKAVDGKVARALKGQFTTEEALREASADFGFEVKRSSDNTVIVRELDGAKSPLSTMKGEKIEITGSRLTRAIDSDGPAPVVSFSREQIAELGASNVGDVLNYLTQQPFANNEVLSFGGSRTVKLRGLAAGNTLVLINGRRTVTSALLAAFNYFDLNTIPVSAVDRIEVLSDSASAVYGADAVAGVVNVILKSSIANPVLDVYAGWASGGADERRASIAVGTAGKLRSALVLDFFRRDFLPGTKRSIFNDQDFTRFGGPDARVTTANPGNITSSTTANLPGLTSRIAAVPVGSSGIGLRPSDFLATQNQTNKESINRFRSPIPESERKSVLGSAEMELAGGVTVFGELLVAQRADESLSTPASISNRAVPAANPFNPFGVAVRATYLLSGLGPRQVVSEADTYRGVAGIKGAIGANWDWELTALGTRETGSNQTLNNVNAARVDAALAATDPSQALNVFADGPGGSPALLESLKADPITNSYRSQGLQLGGFVRGTAFETTSGPASVVFGGEARNEKMHFETLPTIALSADRRTSAAFTELRVPLIAGATRRPGAEELAVTVAGRYDRYSDFGGTFNPMGGVEWKAFPNLLLRASAARSFRTPSMYELYLPPSRFQGTQFIDPRRGNESVVGSEVFGGNRDLDPERSKSLTVGFVASSKDRKTLQVSANYWRLSQEDRIQALTSSIILANEGLFPERVSRSAPTGADTAAGRPGTLLSVDTTNMNFGALRTSGIDARMVMSTETSIGRILPSASATWIREYRIADVPGTPVMERTGVANTLGTIPKWRGTLSLGWDGGVSAAAVTARYMSAYADADIFNVRNGRHISSQTLVDVQASFQVGRLFGGWAPWSKNTVLRIGVVNAFDKGPQYSQVTSFGFDPSGADLRQRFMYVSLSKTL